MNKLKLILPLLTLLISSCGTGRDSSITLSDGSGESLTSESSTSIVTSSSSEKQWEKHVSNRNPMNEPYISNQYYLNHIGDIYNTWKDLQGNGITIAVIDHGFKADHPDFTYEDGTSKVSNKSASFVYNTSTQQVTTTPGNSVSNLAAKGYGDENHGTFCAGIAAAGINGKGIMGIAPLAELMLLTTDGYVASVKEAFHYAVTHGAKVITISIGDYPEYGGDLRNDGINNITTDFTDVVNECRSNGIAVISAAGNGGQASRPTDKTYPGGTPGVIGVGGLKYNSSDKLWSGTSYNPSNASDKVFCDVFAPADGMFSCSSYPVYNSQYYDGGYDYTRHQQKWIGTSFASPIVAGIAALYFERYPNNSVEQFEQELYTHSHLFNPQGLSQNNIRHGRVDVGYLLGTTLNTQISAKVKNSGDLYMYLWNSVTGVNNSWPGTYIGNYDNHTYSISMDASKYDSVIFNTGGGTGGVQSIDLSISSFIYQNTLNMDDVTELDEATGSGKAYIGKFISN